MITVTIVNLCEDPTHLPVYPLDILPRMGSLKDKDTHIRGHDEGSPDVSTGVGRLVDLLQLTLVGFNDHESASADHSDESLGSSRRCRCV